MTDPPGAPPDASAAAQLPIAARVPPAIRVRHLWHRYGALDVVRDVNLRVEQGEIFGFVGPNGAGKTTTIRVMATLLEPMAGRVEIDGIDVSIDPDRVRRIIGYMPDHAGVYERITVREYLEFFADAFGAIEISVVDAVIELTELGNLQHRLVAVLSKGMKQRLQLARTLLHDPKVLILDEPASDLDPRARIEIRDLLLELRELGKTIFLSSHILTELSDVCTSVGILERGRLLVAGPISEIAERLRQQQARSASSAALSPRPTPAAFDPADQPHPRVPPAADPAPTRSAAAPTEPDSAGQQPTLDSEVDPVAHSRPPTAAAANGAVVRPPGVTKGGALVPASARKRLKLRVLGDPRHAAGLIAGGSGVLSVETGAAGQLLVHYTGDERFVAEVVRHLCAHGVGLVEVEPERNQLERIFMEVTRGELQ